MNKVNATLNVLACLIVSGEATDPLVEHLEMRGVVEDPRKAQPVDTVRSSEKRARPAEPEKSQKSQASPKHRRIEVGLKDVLVRLENSNYEVLASGVFSHIASG